MTGASKDLLRSSPSTATQAVMSIRTGAACQDVVAYFEFMKKYMPTEDAQDSGMVRMIRFDGTKWVTFGEPVQMKDAAR